MGLLGATVLVAALGAWTLVGSTAQGSALVRSQREGSDQLIVLSRARILALRSLSDENLRLIERGTEASDLEEDFAAVTTSVGGADGLRVDCSALRPAGRAHRIHDRDRAHPPALGRLPGGPRPGARSSTTPGSTGRPSTSPSRTRQTRTRWSTKAWPQRSPSAEARLRANAADAGRHLRWLAATVAVTVLVAALLVVTGLWVRIKEYR